MGRIADLRAKAQRRTRNIYDTWFTRRVSIYVTALLYPLGVSANAVSAVNCLVAVAACAGIGLGTGWQVIAGVACVHLLAVLDSVDGELARLRQTFTVRGLFLEDLCAFTMINGMFLALGCYLWRTQHLAWPLALAVAVVAFGRNAMQVARRAILAAVEAGRPATKTTLGAQTSLVRYLFEHVLLHFTNMWVIASSCVLVEELGGLHRLRLVLYTLVFFSAAVLVKEAAVILTFATTDALDRQVGDVHAHVHAAGEADPR
jgi:phosphatidylglycerophosphate synthase